MSIKEKYTVKSISKHLCKEWLLYKHYAKRIPSISYGFGLYDNKNILQGVCTYGLPPQNNCTLLCGEENKNFVFELNRLVKNDNLPKNTQSYFVSKTFKLLPKPLIIISYSDSNYGHNGYTYQALNFLYTGEGGSANEYVFRGKKYTARHINKDWVKKRGGLWNEKLTINQNFLNLGGEIIKQKPKYRYVIFLGSKSQKKKFKKLLKWQIKNYPKGNNKRYDSSYKPTIQKELF